MPTDKIVVQIEATEVKNLEQRIKQINAAANSLSKNVERLTKRAAGKLDPLANIEFRQAAAVNLATGKMQAIAPTKETREQIVKLEKALAPQELHDLKEKGISQREIARRGKQNRKLARENEIRAQTLELEKRKVIEEDLAAQKEALQKQGYAIVEYSSGTADLRKQRDKLARDFVNETVRPRIKEAADYIRRGKAQRDPTLLKEAEKLLGGPNGLYSTDVEKAVPKGVWQSIKQNWDKLTDAIKTVDEELKKAANTLTPDERKLRTAQRRRRKAQRRRIARKAVAEQRATEEDVSVLMRQARFLLQRGKTKKDLAYLNKAEQTIGSLYTTQVQGTVSKRTWQSIESLFTSVGYAKADVPAMKAATQAQKDFAYELNQARHFIMGGKRTGNLLEVQYGEQLLKQLQTTRGTTFTREQQQRFTSVERAATEAQTNIQAAAAEEVAGKQEAYNKRRAYLTSLRRRKKKARARRHAHRAKTATRERSREMSQNIMGAASAGIGLFGQAGFPLLNIAFASMSGGPHAAIAAFATAAGEGARAIMRLQDAATQAAEGLGAVGRTLKMSKGGYEAVKAFYGVLQQGSQDRYYQERIGAMKGAGPSAAMPWMMLGNMRTNLSNVMYKPGNALNPVGSAWGQTLDDMGKLPGTMREARTSMYRQLNQYQAKFESPEDMWKRIQAAAASPKDENRRIAEQQLRLMDEQIKAMEGLTETLNILKSLPGMKGVDIRDTMGPAGTAMWAGWSAGRGFAEWLFK